MRFDVWWLEIRMWFYRRFRIEQCAQIADDHGDRPAQSGFADGYVQACNEIGAAIRAMKGE